MKRIKKVIDNEKEKVDSVIAHFRESCKSEAEEVKNFLGGSNEESE